MRVGPDFVTFDRRTGSPRSSGDKTTRIPSLSNPSLVANAPSGMDVVAHAISVTFSAVTGAPNPSDLSATTNVPTGPPAARECVANHPRAKNAATPPIRIATVRRIVLFVRTFLPSSHFV